MGRVPHPHSLAITLDRINERHFLGESSDRTEAERTVDWLAGRFGAGAWRRFPFFYSLLALSEVDTPNARRAVSYALPECDRRLRTLRRNTPFGMRRYRLLSRIHEKYGT